MRIIGVFVFFIIFTSFLGSAQNTSLIFPKNGQTQISDSVFFSWNPDTSATSYQLDVSNDIGFSSPVVYTVIESDTLIELSVGVHYVRVRSDDDGTFGPYSSIREINVVDINSYSPVSWYNPDSALTIDGSNKVLSWGDISGNTNEATQATSSDQPTYISSSVELNGKPTIAFDGSDFLSTPFLNTTDLEVYVVCKGNSSNNKIFGFGRGFWVNFNGTGALIYLESSNYRYFQPHQTNGVYKIQNFGFLNGEAAAVSSFLHINKQPLTFGPALQNSNFVVQDLLIGGNAVSGLNGEIAEVIVFDTHVNASEREVISDYLRYKYAPPVNLGYDISMYGFCDTTIQAEGYFESYLWSDGSTADSLVVSEPGTYWVETTDIFGFTSRDTVEVSYPVFNYPNQQTYCPSDSITWYTNLGSDYNYLWSDGSTADSLSIDSPGDYHVEITDTNGCVFRSDTLTFGPDPFESIVSLGPDLSLCSGNTLTLQDGDSLAIDYLWNTSSTDSAIVLNNSGTYYVDVVNANGCEASDTIDITIIGDAPVVSFGAPTSVCQGELFNFEDMSNTTDGSTINGWNWELGDGTTITVDDSSHIYNSDGSYDIDLTVTTSAGCSNTLTQQIDVIPKPELTFVSSNECQNALIQFNGGQLSPTTISSWEWAFDDPSSGANNTAFGQNVTHVYENAGDYDVMLIGTDINGCIDTVVQSKTILPAPQVEFDFQEVCEGNVVTFVNETTIDPPGVIITYNWSFGDGTNSGQAEPQKPYNASGSYTVNLTANSNNGCFGQHSEDLKVHAIPIVDQIVESSCAGLNTSFTDNSFVADGSIGQVFWSFDNSAPVQGFTVDEVFQDPGSIEVEQSVISAFGCTNSETFNIEVEDFLDASFSYFPNAFIVGTPIEFSSTSVGANYYEWEFENLGNSNLQDTAIIFPESMIGESISVQLAVENSFGCRDSVIVENVVLERTTDLEVDELFLQEQNGFYTVGVRLTNKGTTPINEVDLIYNSPSQSPLLETWEGLLLAGETTIYVFDASPSSVVSYEDSTQNFVCVRGTIEIPTIFDEPDLSNNEACKSIDPSSTVIVAPQPNPIGDNYSVRVITRTAQLGSLKVYDAQGKMVDVVFENYQLEKGLNTFEVDASNYANGGYTLQFIGDDQNVRVKLIKQ